MEEAWQSAYFVEVDSHKSGGLRQSFYTKGLKCKMQPKDGMPISMQMLRHLGSSIMQGFPNINSVEPPTAPQKQRRRVSSQTQLMITTKIQFMKAQHSQASIEYIDKPVCQMPSDREYNMSMCASIHI